MTMTAAEIGNGTRAVVRPIEAGTEDTCPTDHGGCGRKVKFLAQIPLRYRRRVLANVYWHGRWNRAEVWHVPCYVAAGCPYGIPADLKPEELQDLRMLIGEGLDPTIQEGYDEILVRMGQLSRARKDPTFRPVVTKVTSRT